MSDILVLRRALKLLALNLPALEARLSHAAFMSPGRARELLALSGTLDLLRSEHNRIARDLDRLQRLASSE